MLNPYVLIKTEKMSDRKLAIVNGDLTEKFFNSPNLVNLQQYWMYDK